MWVVFLVSLLVWVKWVWNIGLLLFCDSSGCSIVCVCCLVLCLFCLLRMVVKVNVIGWLLGCWCSRVLKWVLVWVGWLVWDLVLFRVSVI